MLNKLTDNYSFSYFFWRLRKLFNIPLRLLKKSIFSFYKLRYKNDKKKQSEVALKIWPLNFEKHLERAMQMPEEVAMEGEFIKVVMETFDIAVPSIQFRLYLNYIEIVVNKKFIPNRVDYTETIAYKNCPNEKKGELILKLIRHHCNICDDEFNNRLESDALFRKKIKYIRERNFDALEEYIEVPKYTINLPLKETKL